MKSIHKTRGYVLMSVLIVSMIVGIVSAGMMWPVRSAFTAVEQEKAIWDDLARIANAIRLFAAEKGYPPHGVAMLEEEGYLGGASRSDIKPDEWGWSMEYGKIRIFAGEKNEETGEERYAHDTRGIPFMIAAEYKSPEPVVYVRPSPLVEDGVAKYYNDVHAYDNYGRFLFSFKTPDTAVSAAGYTASWRPVVWSPISDRFLVSVVTEANENKIYEYSFKGEKIREFAVDVSLKNASMAVGNDGRIFIARLSAVAGEDGLVCYTKDGTRLWSKKIGSDFTTNTEALMSPILNASAITRDGNVVVYCNSQYVNKEYSPAGVHVQSKSGSYVVQSLPDGTFLSYAHANQKAYRTDSNWVALTNASNTLDLSEYGGVGQSAFSYGRHYVLSRDGTKFVSFDWNPNFGEEKENLHVVDLKNKTYSFTVRKGTDVWASTSIDSTHKGYLSKISYEFGVEKSFYTTSITGFNSRAVGIAPDNAGNIYVASVVKNGVYKISGSSGSLLQTIASSSPYMGLSFDDNGYLWAARYGQPFIDVFDVTSPVPGIIFTINTGNMHNSTIQKDTWGRMWVTAHNSWTTSDMLPRVYDRNGNFLFQFDGNGTLPSHKVSGIAFLEDGTMFFGVVDGGENSLYVYNSSGELRNKLPLFSGTYGYGMDIDITGRLWVAEGGTSNISIYDASFFKKLSDFSLTGLGTMMFLKTRPISRPLPELFAVNSSSSKIRALDKSLALSSEFGEYGSGLAWRLRTPLGAAAVGERLFVADRDNRRIYVSSTTGLYRESFGENVLKSPLDIEVDEVTGRSFVLDKKSSSRTTVEVFDAVGRHVENGLPWKEYLESNPDTVKYKLSSDVRGIGYFGDYGRKSRLVVADTGNDRVAIYDGLGYYVHAITGLNAPVDAAVDPDTLRIFVLESGSSSVKVYSVSGQTHTLIRTIGSAGTTNGKLDRPVKIAVGGGSLYVADNNRIQRFNSSTGAWIGTYSLGTGNAHTGGLALKKTPKAYLYAADYDRKRVIAYDAWGNFVSELLVKKESGETPLGDPVSPKAVAVDMEGHIYIADALNFIRKYTPDGAFMTKFGGAGTGNGKLSNVYDMHVHDQSLYVTERGNNRVQKFDTSGNFQLVMATVGIVGGYVSNPGGIAVDPQDGKLWVMDTGNHRMQMFDSTGTFAKVAGIRGSGVPVIDETGAPQGEMELESPLSAAVVGSEMLVLDNGNGRLQRTDADGAFKAVDIDNLPTGILSMKAGADGRVFAPWSTDGVVAVFRAGSSVVEYVGEAGTGRGQLNNPVSVAVAPVYRENVPGFIYGLCSDGKIRAYDDEMNFLFSFGGISYGVGELVSPRGIAVPDAGDNVFVYDVGLGQTRIYMFDSTGVLRNTYSEPYSAYYKMVVHNGQVLAVPREDPGLPLTDFPDVLTFDSSTGNVVSRTPFHIHPYFKDSAGHAWRLNENTTDPTKDTLLKLDSSGQVFGSYVPYLYSTGYYGSYYYMGIVPIGSSIFTTTPSQLQKRNLTGEIVLEIKPGIDQIHTTVANSGIKPVNNRTQLLVLGRTGIARRYDLNLSPLHTVDVSHLPSPYNLSVLGGTCDIWWKASTNRYYRSLSGIKKAYAFASGASSIIRNFGYYNVSATNFSSLIDIKIKNNKIYILDTTNKNIKCFDLYGNFLWRYGDAAGLPTGLNTESYNQMDIVGNVLGVSEQNSNSARITFINATTGTLIKRLSGIVTGGSHTGGFAFKNASTFFLGQYYTSSPTGRLYATFDYASGTGTVISNTNIYIGPTWSGQIYTQLLSVDSIDRVAGYACRRDVRVYIHRSSNNAQIRTKDLTSATNANLYNLSYVNATGEVLALFNDYDADAETYSPTLHRYSSARFFDTNAVTPDRGEYKFPQGKIYIIDSAVNE